MHFVVVGGGVCGVSAVQRLVELVQEVQEEQEAEGGEGRSGLLPLRISLVSPSPVLKVASNVQRVSALRESFDVDCASTAAFLASLPRSPQLTVTFHLAELCSISPSTSTVQLRPVLSSCSSTSSSSSSSSASSPPPVVLSYDRLLLAMGARPAQPFDESERVHVLRDVDSIEQLTAALQRSLGGVEEGRGEQQQSGRVLVVGNGGIAMEVMHALSCSPLLQGQRERLVWCVKDDFLCNTFLDNTASAFLLPLLFPYADPVKEERRFDEQQRLRHVTGAVDRERRQAGAAPPAAPAAAVRGTSQVYGGALGPHWQRHLQLHDPEHADAGREGGRPAEQANALLHPPGSRSVVTLHFNCIVTAVATATAQPSSPPLRSPSPLLRVRLSNGLQYDCALLLSATGVVANTAMLEGSGVQLSQRSGDAGGVLVSPSLRSSVPRVYAAGDCASATFPSSPHFFHMRLWGQARVMGRNAATSMWEDAVGDMWEEEKGGEEHEQRWLGHDDDDDEGRFFYPLFLHELRLLGERVLLMGLFNEERWREKQRERRERTDVDDGGRGGRGELKVLMRVRPHGDGVAGAYVKVLMQGGAVQGCTLIGDTDLEELMENLIVNQLHIDHLGDAWLHADVDLQDFFD